MEFANLVETVAKKLGVTIEKVYPILHQRMMYDMYMDTFWVIFSLIIIGVSIFTLYKMYKIAVDDVLEGWHIGACVVSVIAIIIFILVLIVCVEEMFYIYQSPDYYMLQLLKNIIK